MTETSGSGPAAGSVLTRWRRPGVGFSFAVAHLLVGAWLLASPTLLAGTAVDGLDDLAAGGLLVGLAVYGVYVTATRARPNGTALLLGAFVGMWLLAFSLEYGDGALLTYDSAIAGAFLVGTDVYLYRRVSRVADALS